MSRRSPERIAKDEAFVLRFVKARKAGTTKEAIRTHDAFRGFTGLDAALRSLVKAKKVKKKGKTRAMVYTAK